MQAAGYPDLRIAHPMWRGWLELKVNNNQLSDIQARQMKELCESCDPAFCMRHLEDSKVIRLEDHRGLILDWAGSHELLYCDPPGEIFFELLRKASIPILAKAVP